jgi:multiple sugar transport system permease protein
LGIAFSMTKYAPGNGGQGDYQYVMVAALLVTLPLLALFAAGQRYFIEGVATQGRKG